MSAPSSRRQSSHGLRLPLWAVILLVLAFVLFLVVSSIWLFRTVAGIASDLDVISPNFTDDSQPAPQIADPITEETENRIAEKTGT